MSSVICVQCYNLVCRMKILSHICIMCLHSSMQEKNIIEHTNVNSLIIMYQRHMPHNISEPINAKISDA